MPTLTITRPSSGPALVGTDPMVPRDDILVAERIVRSDEHATEFEALHGPFRRWRRTVEVVDGGTVETIDWSFNIGIWTPLFVIPLRRTIRRRPDPDERPWWLPPDRLDARAASVLSAAGSLAVIGGYLATQLTMVLTFMGRDFGAGVARQTEVLIAIRIGALLTLLGMWLADRLGRRPLAIGCLLLAAVCAVATAAAPTLVAATGLQLVCRASAVVAVLLLPVCACEELPAGSRAFATGLLALCGGFGVGLVIFTLPLADLNDTWSWRIVFLTALATFPLIVVAGRRLPESQRFEALVELEAEHRPVAKLQASRLAALGIALVMLNAFVTPVSQLQNEFLRDARGFSAVKVSTFLIVTGALGGAGVVIGGRLADRRSRHLVGTIGLIGIAGGNAMMYSTSGWPMWVGSTIGSAVGALCVPALGVLSPELFPTSRRGAANGVLNGAGVVGATVGLLVAHRLIDTAGYGRTISLLALGPLVVILLLRLLPETARLTLEELNPGDVAEPLESDDPTDGSGAPEPV